MFGGAAATVTERKLERARAKVKRAGRIMGEVSAMEDHVGTGGETGYPIRSSTSATGVADTVSMQSQHDDSVPWPRRKGLTPPSATAAMPRVSAASGPGNAGRATAHSSR